MKKIFLLVALLFVTFFVDDQISFFLSSLTNYGWVFTSLSFVIALFYLGMMTTSLWLYPLLFILGIFYDAHHFTTIGLAAWVFPLLFLMIGKLRPLLFRGFWERFLLMFMMMTFLSLMFYLLAYIYGLTTYPITYFVTFNLAPSLLLTSLYLLTFQPQCDKIFLGI